jgi:hypothetical protein
MIESKIFIPSPAEGTGVFGATYYCENESLRIENLYNMASQSDAPNMAFVRYSDDNGRTWSEPEELKAVEKFGDGIKRIYHRGGYLDPASGRYITIRNEGVFPSDKYDADICMKSLQLYYRVSENGGRTFIVDEPIIQKGNEFDAGHPLPGVWKGKNSVMLGDFSCRPVTLDDGTILVPCQISPVDADGNYCNPGNGYTYHESAVLIGKWTENKRLEWELSEMIRTEPKKSTRGLLEPTLTILDDGTVLMIMRGSNEIMLSRNPDKAAPVPGLGGYKWYAVSKDRGRSWSEAKPWTYENDEIFYSPSACSELLRHSNGKIYWLGNIAPNMTAGNSPRYPLVIGEVNTSTGKLIKSSCSVVDNRRADEPENMTLSNFCACEDRESGEIVLHMPRLGTKESFLTADLLEYRIKV